jgi:hypothetical protein
MHLGKRYESNIRSNDHFNRETVHLIKANNMRIYLAGPMTGIDEYNFPLFNKTARELRLYNHEVFNPAELNRANETPLKETKFYLIRDLTVLMLFDFDVIVLLPDSDNSPGVKIEKFLAENLVNIPVIPVRNFYEEHKIKTSFNDLLHQFLEQNIFH